MSNTKKDKQKGKRKRGGRKKERNIFKIRREERMKTSRLKKPMILIMSTLKIEEKNTR